MLTLGEQRVVVKGAGDLASGVAYRLHQSGFTVVMTEIAQPTVVRRGVSFAQAVFDGTAVVEGVRARLSATADDALVVARSRDIAVVVDPEAHVVRRLRPVAVVDAIVAKRNTGTTLDDAPIVIGLGPGFRAGVDVHAVVETNRGHRLGRVILDGEAEPDTGVPAPVEGHGADRVLRAPADGVFVGVRGIGDRVAAGEVVGLVGTAEVRSAFAGCLRGLIQTGVHVRAGMKIGDVDPRAAREHCFTISDKALAVGGGVLEAVLYLFERQSLRTLAAV
ncbi:MAG TPA: selenium-dependent molybdenum cofactor biosynthesis protein YqeB [Candidatus Limnocylindria bacterium]|nr:selenium-dependent molybdenum cofactor biosynthesis protein YqeB [Candidatus Limnocylindria bacterium]